MTGWSRILCGGRALFACLPAAQLPTCGHLSFFSSYLDHNFPSFSMEGKYKKNLLSDSNTSVLLDNEWASQPIYIQQPTECGKIVVKSVQRQFLMLSGYCNMFAETG